MSSERFVCGFYGARDSYQLPLALLEAGRLDVLLTDHYGDTAILRSKGMVRATRSSAAIPETMVRGSFAALLARKICGRLIADLELRNLVPDRMLSRRMAAAARKQGAHIATYEPYAVERRFLPPECKQVVFYYHPHVDTEDAIYAADRAKFGKFYVDYAVTSSPWRRRTADAWKQADLVLCASSFTKNSLVAAGMPEGKAVVVPYGISMEREADGGGRRSEVGRQTSEVGGRRSEVGDQKSEDRGQMADGELLMAETRGQSAGLRLLFVGRGAMRKGLHHLLLAWQAAARTTDDRLTIVCSESFPILRRMAAELKGVEWINSLNGPELNAFYDQSDAVVVPSLCEGFGHVYLEGMSRGCVVVGTANSALPDFGGQESGVFTVSPREPGELAALISEVSRRPEVFRDVSEAAKQRAGGFTWERFRQGIVEATRRIG